MLLNDECYINSYPFPFCIGTVGFLIDCVVFVMDPSLIYIITNTSSIFANNFEKMRAWDSSSEVISTLTSPTAIFKVIHQIKPIVSFIFFIWYISLMGLFTLNDLQTS